jgi:hypothetical protein
VCNYMQLARVCPARAHGKQTIREPGLMKKLPVYRVKFDSIRKKCVYFSSQQSPYTSSFKQIKSSLTRSTKFFAYSRYAATLQRIVPKRSFSNRAEFDFICTFFDRQAVVMHGLLVRTTV